MGIEPTQPAWKAGILPLNYARKDPPKQEGPQWGKQDSNLRRLSHQIYSLAHLAALVFPRCIHTKLTTTILLTLKISDQATEHSWAPHRS